MGAGKTSVGQSLAHFANMDFIDIDAQIEKIAKMPIPHIFEMHGEGHFRYLEHEVYREMIPSLQNTVISTGGGAVLDERTRTILRENALIVYLTASPATILARIGGSDDRPLLRGSAKIAKIAKISALMLEREDVYRSTCHFAVDTDTLSIDACAGKVLGLTKRYM